MDIRYEYYAPLAGPAYVVYVDGESISGSSTRELAEAGELARQEFGYFDPGEKRQQEWLRDKGLFPFSDPR